VSAEAIGILHGIEKNLNINGLYTGSGSILLYARRADGSWFRDEYAPEQLRASAAQVLARVKKDT